MAKSFWLIPQAGPELSSVELSGDQPLLVGRHEKCERRLPVDADQVSRIHARFTPDDTGWRVTDLNSRWGTYLNGAKLQPGHELPISPGDLLKITPWTFNVSATPTAPRALTTVDDSHYAQTLVHAPEVEEGQLGVDYLPILLEAAAGIHAAQTETELAELVLEQAAKGTGLPNAALLRPTDTTGGVEVLASKLADGQEGAPFSRALIAAASIGKVVELGEADFDTSQSIVQMQISSALCVPVMLGSMVAAYLYLDRRSRHRAPVQTGLPSGAAAFAQALARMAGLALANLKRLDIERRQAMMVAELNAGAEAQKWILPPRRGEYYGYRYSGESRPGQFVGGDFFDVININDHRIGIALADVTGKGVGASVLMTASQGYLHAALRRAGDLCQAVRELNAFLSPRRPSNRFVTLWVGTIDARTQTLRYVDAGHGYAMLWSDSKCQWLTEGGGLPLGIDDEPVYTEHAVQIQPGSRIVVVSDGIIEQLTAGGMPEGDQFGQDRVEQTVSALAPEADAVEALFTAVTRHAGGNRLADDATVLEVRL